MNSHPPTLNSADHRASQGVKATPAEHEPIQVCAHIGTGTAPEHKRLPVPRDWLKRMFSTKKGGISTPLLQAVLKGADGCGFKEGF